MDNLSLLFFIAYHKNVLLKNVNKKEMKNKQIKKHLANTILPSLLASP